MSNKIFHSLILLLLIILVIVNLIAINLSTKNLKIQDKNLEITEDLFLGDLTYQYFTDLNNCIDAKIQSGIKDENTILKEQCKEEMRNTNLYQKIQQFGGEEYIK